MNFKEGELIIYQCGPDRFHIGKIKRLTDRGAFVWYHEGETASLTPYQYMHSIENVYCITNTSLGGNDSVSD